MLVTATHCFAVRRLLACCAGGGVKYKGKYVGARTVHVVVLCVGLQARNGRHVEGTRVEVAVPGARDSMCSRQCREIAADEAHE